MKKIFTLTAIPFLLSNLSPCSAQDLNYIGEWDNVTSFSLNGSGNHLVFSLRDASGKERAYESFKVSNEWSEKEAIDAINSNATGVSVGGLHLTSDENRIYFHANYPNGVGGFDLYYSEKTSDGWGEPQLIEELSTSGDDMYPTTAPGNALIYFLKPLPIDDLQNVRQDNSRMCIYSSTVDGNGKWTKVRKAAAALNNGYVQDVRLASDGVTLLFSTKEDKKSQAFVWSATKIGDDVWDDITKVELDFDNYSDADVLSPSLVNGKFYAILLGPKKKNHDGSIATFKVKTDGIALKSTICESVSVIDKATQTPLAAKIVLKHGISGKVLGLYNTSASDGATQIIAARNTPYEMDITASGYAKATVKIASRSDSQEKKTTVKLINTTTLVATTVDANSFCPVEASIVAVRTSDRSIIRPQTLSTGEFLFTLPIGDKYNVIASAKNHDKNEYLLDLSGDVVESQFFQEISLAPTTKQIIVNVIDNRSKSAIPATLTLKNDQETLTAQASNGFAQIDIRENATYELTVSANGFISSQSEISDNATVALNHAHAGASFTMSGFEFAQKTALMTEKTEQTILPIVEMLQSNKYLKIKIQAYADDAQSSGERMRLSAARSAALASYIVSYGIESKRVEAVQNSSECLSLTHGETKFDILAND